jgi:hypothetical protein
MMAQQISINYVTDSGVVHARVTFYLRFNANRVAVLVFEQRIHSGSYLSTKSPN